MFSLGVCRVHSKLLEVAEMRCHRASHGLEFMVWKVALTRCLFDDIGNLVVVDMADVREKVMLNLVVKSARKPVHDSVARSKIRGRV